MTSTINSSAMVTLDQLEIRAIPGKGKGVFATTHIPAKTLVVVGKFVKEFSQRTSHTFQIDWNRHVKLDEMAELMNHSCAPNLAVSNNGFGGYNFYSIQPIQPGEELTWDYGMTEAESIAVENCLCGSTQCRGRSVGFTELGSEQQHMLYSKGVALYLSEWYMNQIDPRKVSESKYSIVQADEAH